MITTGWIGEDPEPAPPMPLTALALQAKQPVPGGVVAASMARVAAAEVREERARAAAAVDPDEYGRGASCGRSAAP